MNTSYSFPCGYLVDDYNIGDVIGKILTTIEAVGLPSNQEKAVKDMIRNEFYTLTGERCTWVPGNLRGEIEKLKALDTQERYSITTEPVPMANTNLNSENTYEIKVKKSA